MATIKSAVKRDMARSLALALSVFAIVSAGMAFATSHYWANASQSFARLSKSNGSKLTAPLRNRICFI